MNIILYILFALYVCWTSLIVVASVYSLIVYKTIEWQAAYRNTWLVCTATVLLYFWFK